MCYTIIGITITIEQLEVIFMDIMKDEFGNALDAYRATFDEDFPTMDFMGLSTEELTDKIWECIDNGSPIESNFDDEIKY